MDMNRINSSIGKGRMVIAILLSLLGPGLGQIYNREYRKGILLLVFTSLLFLLPFFWLIKKIAPFLPDTTNVTVQPEMFQSIAEQVIKKDPYSFKLIVVPFLLFFGLWAYAIVQSFFKAQEISEKESASKEKKNEE